MSETFTIGISDMKVAKSMDSLVTYALGSCVGICLYDPVMKVGGLGHIMLPTYPVNNPKENRFRFADTCIPEMLLQMEKLGCNRRRITAKIAGGAKMFEVADDSSFGNIGQRNISEVKNTLSKLQIRICAEDTGLNYGRTVYFYTEDGRMVVKSFSNGIKTY
ncbi:chemotaxis protein CheD [Clostridium sp. KNHs216]|jgi:Chemotaxis protein; stimulates methylation of MCP proteins|uniref:chemotaxis protein CheD n=1 Tax=Eubacteriales TaxID=186802 RepID=UPI0011520E9C|nr:chemotaxis protein CheD [Clostridium sp. KNHs216]MBE6829574.1 chemotaxis protein CheD [Oscillospiraceae bacterium]TQI65467.1 chemotaxis protein CheD [Clostridium sp. KNHs216]